MPSPETESSRPTDGTHGPHPIPHITAQGDDEFGVSPEEKRSWAAETLLLAALAGGGALGALSRYSLSLALPTEAAQFPWCTFLINVSGSAVLGFFLILMVERFPKASLARSVIGAGFIGGYTTFSTFIVEALLLIRDGHAQLAFAYLMASSIVGLLAAAAGVKVARLVFDAALSPEQA